MRLRGWLYIPLALSVGALGGACAPATVSGSVGVTAAAPGEPALAHVAPGVEVVTDWGTPVFFADDCYWFWDGGLWYRSPTFGGERILVRHVPSSLARLREPGRYAHYRAREHAWRPMPEHDRRWAHEHASMGHRRR